IPSGLSAGASGSVWPAVGVDAATPTRPAQYPHRTAVPTRAAKAGVALRAPSRATGPPLRPPPLPPVARVVPDMRMSWHRIAYGIIASFSYVQGAQIHCRFRD